MQLTIFYAWQSDSPNNINRGFIERAAETAAKLISKDSALGLSIVLDSDTQRVPGTPGVADAILQKITQCDLFLCDLTIVSDNGATVVTPNPNVLLELGYAAAKIGWERIIIVLNESTGGPRDLPFDLEHRRWPIRYSLAPDAGATDRKTQKEQLGKSIESAIRAAITGGVAPRRPDPKDQRVVRWLIGSFSMFTFTIRQFLVEFGDEDAMNVFTHDFSDDPRTGLPDTATVDAIMLAFAEHGLSGPSGQFMSEDSLSWSAALMHIYANIVSECERVLDKFGDREETLITLTENVQARANSLRSALSMAFTIPSFEHFYDDGIPTQQFDIFRDFMLTVLKSYRIAREFGLNV
ncbi:MAG TPA: hypothetical protein VGE45_01670 [Chloroflexia bacterium]|jgi:hypothetical protein